MLKYGGKDGCVYRSWPPGLEEVEVGSVKKRSQVALFRKLPLGG